MSIKNTNDLRSAYSLIRFLNENSPDGKYAAWIRNEKRDIRKYTHKRPDKNIVWSDDSGYVEKIEYPAWANMNMRNESDARDYFEIYHYIELANSQYDCTGKPFTSWFHVFNTNGKWRAYHRVSFDV